MKLITLYGSPGSGKSTTAAGIFHQLKKRGVNCEYIQEYAKDKVWSGDHFSLGVQPYIAAKQLYRITRLVGKVDVAVSDGALLSSLIYRDNYVDEHFDEWLVGVHRQFDNINVFIDRDLEHHPYNKSGRMQTLEEAMKLDQVILDMFERISEPFHRMQIGDDLVEKVIGLL